MCVIRWTVTNSFFTTRHSWYTYTSTMVVASPELPVCTCIIMALIKHVVQREVIQSRISSRSTAPPTQTHTLDI